MGDYILANDVTWLIADIDNYLHSGISVHHATIIPSTSLLDISINDTDTTEGGYINSKMAKEILINLVSNGGIINMTFGAHLLEYRTILTNQINVNNINRTGKNTGASDKSSWYSRKIDLMSEQNVYGANAWSSSGYDIGIDKSQYAIFRLRPEYINSYGNNKFHYWLKDIASSKQFSYVASGGDVGMRLTSNTSGVRPRFLID